MYKIGDYTMHGNHGVCKVVEIGTLDMDSTNKDKLYYTLSPIYSKGSMVYTPVDSNKVTMRDVMSVDDAYELISMVTDIPMIEAANDKLLEANIKETLKSYQPLDWLKIIKTLYNKNEMRNTQGKRLSNIDERYLHIAKDLLYGELSIVLECSKEDIEEKLLHNLSEV